MSGAMECQEDWVVEYSRWSGEFANGDYKFHLKEFEDLKNYLSRFGKNVYIAEDHKMLYKLVERDTEVHITNLDFHPDLGVVDRSNIACGTWASALVDLKDCNVTIDWRQLHTKGIHMIDDENDRVDKRIKWSHSLGLSKVFSREYDLIFICQSWLFSPPHMGHKFRELMESCVSYTLMEESLPVFPSYTERYMYWSKGRTGHVNPFYFPTGEESRTVMDEIYDNHDVLVVQDLDILFGLDECDPMWLWSEYELYYADNKTKIVTKDYLGLKNRVSVYDAIELIKYHGYKNDGIDLECCLTDGFIADIECYGWCICLSERYFNSVTDLRALFNLLKQHRKDYVIVTRKGEVDIYHSSTDWDNLKKEGYVPCDDRVETGGGSFAIGLYAYNKKPSDDYKHGKFNGIYFECVFDPDGGEKDGTKNGFSELLLPYGTDSITWSE
jgi:hypothetical protein